MLNFFNRPRKYKLIEYTQEDESLVKWQLASVSFMKDVLTMGHVVFAANRLSAFFNIGVGVYDKVGETLYNIKRRILGNSTASHLCERAANSP